MLTVGRMKAELGMQNIVNVRVVLSASNIMRAALFCIRKTLILAILYYTMTRLNSGTA